MKNNSQDTNTQACVETQISCCRIDTHVLTAGSSGSAVNITSWDEEIHSFFRKRLLDLCVKTLQSNRQEKRVFVHMAIT